MNFKKKNSQFKKKSYLLKDIFWTKEQLKDIFWTIEKKFLNFK